MWREQLIKRIAGVSERDFEEVAMAVFRYQAAHNSLYASYLSYLGRQADSIQRLSEVPPLPISLFKEHPIQTSSWEPEQVFTSSGTTGSRPARHLLRSREWYIGQAIRGFEHFYGSVSGYCWLALLPSYLERSGSSLVAMVDAFVRRSRYGQSGFFLYEYDHVWDLLEKNEAAGVPTILIGVSFALLDLVEGREGQLESLLVMETGGMKGRRRELIRSELHELLQRGFGVSAIHSEYGMTELLSQAYSRGEGFFRAAPTLGVYMRDVTDPLSLVEVGRSGLIQLVDLANIDTCSFILTEDLGRQHPDGTFEVLGRVDSSDIRGCNLMVL